MQLPIPSDDHPALFQTYRTLTSYLGWCFKLLNRLVSDILTSFMIFLSFVEALKMVRIKLAVEWAIDELLVAEWWC